MVLTGNVALESMGFETFGFAGGREDVWEPDEDVYWGPETEWLGDERYSGERDLEEPFGAVQMGLIYVNPGGPERRARPARGRRRHPRDVQPHGHERRGDGRADRRRPLVRQDPRRGRPGRARRPRARGRPARGAGLRLEQQLRHRQGRGRDHERHRGHLDRRPRRSGATASSRTCSATSGSCRRARPARTSGWRRTAPARARSPGRCTDSEARPPTMLTTDLSLRLDPVYGPISRRFMENPDELADAFARAWFKLTHRDMGPIDALPRARRSRTRS